MKISILILVRQMFKENDQLTLKELYDELENNHNLPFSGKKLHHRVRSTLYSMKKSGEIIRTEDSTYKRA